MLKERVFEAYRSRLRPQKKKLERKERFTLAISILALIVSSLSLVASAVTVIVTVLWQSEDLSLVFNSEPYLKLMGSKIEVEPFSIVLINSGRRPAVVHRVTVFVEFDPPSDPTRPCPNDVFAGFDDSGSVIREKAVVAREVNPKRYSSDTHELQKAFIEISDDRREAVQYQICLEISIITPSVAFKNAVLGLTKNVISLKLDSEAIWTKQDVYAKPFVLHRKNGWIFED